MRRLIRRDVYIYIYMCARTHLQICIRDLCKFSYIPQNARRSQIVYVCEQGFTRARVRTSWTRCQKQTRYTQPRIRYRDARSSCLDVRLRRTALSWIIRTPLFVDKLARAYVQTVQPGFISSTNEIRVILYTPKDTPATHTVYGVHQRAVRRAPTLRVILYLRILKSS